VLFDLCRQLPHDGDQNFRKIDVVAVDVVVGLAEDHEILGRADFELLLQPQELGRFAAPLMTGEHLARKSIGQLNRLCEAVHDADVVPPCVVKFDIQITLLRRERCGIKCLIDGSDVGHAVNRV
jgi:hypothetical protein